MTMTEHDRQASIQATIDRLVHDLPHQEATVRRVGAALMERLDNPHPAAPLSILLVTGDDDHDAVTIARALMDTQPVDCRAEIDCAMWGNQQNAHYAWFGLHEAYCGAQQGFLTGFAARHPDGIILLDQFDRLAGEKPVALSVLADSLSKVRSLTKPFQPPTDVMRAVHGVLTKGVATDGFTGTKVDFSGCAVIITAATAEGCAGLEKHVTLTEVLAPRSASGCCRLAERTLTDLAARYHLVLDVEDIDVAILAREAWALHTCENTRSYVSDVQGRFSRSLFALINEHDPAEQAAVRLVVADAPPGHRFILRD